MMIKLKQPTGKLETLERLNAHGETQDVTLSSQTCLQTFKFPHLEHQSRTVFSLSEHDLPPVRGLLHLPSQAPRLSAPSSASGLPRPYTCFSQ